MSDHTDLRIEAEQLLERTQQGDRQAAAELLPRYREPPAPDDRAPARFSAASAARRIRCGAGRTLVDIASRLDDYLKDPKLPFFLWMRLDRRRPADAAAPRSISVEDARHRAGGFALSRRLAAGQLICAGIDALRPAVVATQAAVRAERLVRIQDALNSLDPIDREVLALRHFEQLSPSEAAVATRSEARRRHRSDTSSH